MAVSAKISEKTKQVADLLVSETGDKQIDIIEKAVILYLRRWKIDHLNESFQELRKDKKAWKKMEEERKTLDGTLMDGLENA